MREQIVDALRLAQARVFATQRSLALVGATALSRRSSAAAPSTDFQGNDIYVALTTLSAPLAESYAQIKIDLATETRMSWAGTAHEVREVLRGILEILAPDDLVAKEPWFVQDKNTSGPTQKQRVKYVLRQQRAGANETKVAEQALKLEDMIGEVVRSTYSRASDAAHRRKNRREVARIVNYFEAFAHDLLDIE